ncbi:hypothetical protein CBL_06021 [Carabus blaptoides fortunei]
MPTNLYRIHVCRCKTGKHYTYEHLKKEKKSQKLQRSSELGLYRYNDSDSEPYNQTTGRYVIVLLITIIIVSLTCLITYNYVSEPNPVILQPANNGPNAEIETKYVQLANMSYSKEIISEPVEESVTEPTATDADIRNEPVALEFRHEVDNHQRRQIKTPPRPFIYENRDPIPIGFISPFGQINNQAYPQTQGRNKAKNIQEIIQYLTDHQTINQSADTADPFFPYKPQNPSDVNLLATNGFRFAPTVQIEPKKPKKSVKQAELTGNRHAENVLANVNFDSYPAGNIENTVRKRKNRYPRPPQYGNYGYGPQNAYNENNFYNQGEREPPNRLNYWNRFRNNGIEYNRNKIRNDLLHVSEINKPRQIMVHLNLYPKKKRQNGENRNIELLQETFHQRNCTDNLEEPSDGNDDLEQIKNATEFNQLLQNIKFSYVNHKDESDGQNEEVVAHNNSDDLFQIKDTILKLNEPDEFQHVRNNNHNRHNPEHIEVLKSIGFTVVNSNFTTPDSNTEQYAHNQDHWYPMRINNGGYLNDQLADMSSNIEHVTEINPGQELNIDFDTTGEFTDETVTLPLPRDIFERYFNNKKTPLKSNIDWDEEMLVANPNLINHKSHFNDLS